MKMKTKPPRTYGFQKVIVKGKVYDMRDVIKKHREISNT
jgi:hypothetical protein